jgi:hypothetical protein
MHLHPLKLGRTALPSVGATSQDAVVKPDPSVVRSEGLPPLAFAAAVLLGLHVLVPAGVLGQITYNAFTVGGAVLAAVAARRLPGRRGRPWR